MVLMERTCEFHLSSILRNFHKENVQYSIMQVYTEPEYYEIAFSSINAQKQVDLFEGFIAKYSRIEVNRIVNFVKEV